MNRLTLTRAAAAAVTLSLSLAGAYAQTSGTGGSGSGPFVTGPATPTKPAARDAKLARSDRQFIEQAAESGLFEVEIGKLAATKATDPAVKTYAIMLADHHTTANNELMRLASARGVELPAAPPRALRRDVEKLGKKTGTEFDQDYVREVGIKAHEKDIKLFEKASKDAKDPQLKAWAAKTLPTLQAHLAQAQKLPQAGRAGNDAARMGNSGSGSTANKTGG